MASGRILRIILGTLLIVAVMGTTGVGTRHSTAAAAGTHHDLGVAAGQRATSAELSVLPAPTVGITPTSGSFNTPIVITGSGFGAHEPVYITADTIYGTPIYSATTDASGAFTVSVRVVPGTHGQHTIYARGTVSGAVGSTTFFMNAELLVPPYYATVGQPVHALGYGFAAGEQVEVVWNSPRRVLGTATTNYLGSFYGTAAISFTVPAGAAPGKNVVYGVGKTSGVLGVGAIIVH
jgi:hypothetical protein